VIAAEFKCLKCRNTIRIYKSGLEDHYDRVSKAVKEWCRLHKPCQKVKVKEKKVKKAEVERVLQEAEQVLKREEERAVKEAERIIRREQKKDSEQKGFRGEAWYLEQSKRIMRQFLSEDEINEIMGGD